MSGSIVQAVAQIKRNVAEFLTAESIVEACRETGHLWRERELGPAATVWAFLLQVLHGNTSCALSCGWPNCVVRRRRIARRGLGCRWR